MIDSEFHDGHTNRMIRVSTDLTETGVVQKMDVMGEISYRFVHLCGTQMDEAIRKKLIEMGWTPPAETGETK